MTDRATETMRMNAAPERVFAVTLDFDRYPEWAGDIKEVHVLERDAQGRGTLVQFRAAALGQSTRYTLAYDYADAPHSLSWIQRQGDITRKLDGAYTFDAADDGATDVTYTLEVELKLPLINFIKRRAEHKILHTALRELRARAESDVT